MIKKIISWFLVLSICLSGINAFAEKSQTDDNVSYSIVTGLGFIDETKSRTEEVSRGEFSSIALKLYGIPTADAHSYGADTPFADVSAEHYKSADILNANKMGIMKGYGDGSFYPEQSIILSEAVKVIMDLLGYAEYIPYVGGYPIGYMTEAAKIDLILGIDKGYDSAITYGELAEMIYNVLDEPLVLISGMGTDSINFERDENITFLSKYHSIYQGTGVVSATSVTKINAAYDSAVSSQDAIEINDIPYLTESSEFDKLLGMNVEFYYKENKNNNTLIYAIDRDNKIASFTGDDIVSANSYTIEVYLENGKLTTYHLEDTGNVIYNGIFADKIINYQFGDISSVNGTIRITDTNGNGKYDVVFITDYKNYIVEKSSEDAEKIILKDNAGSFIVELNNSDVFCSILKSGAEIAPSELESGVLVSVADSNNVYSPKGTKRSVTLVVSDTSFSASVSEVSTEGVYLWQKGSPEGGILYELSDDFFGQNGETNLTIHSSGVFYIDVMGKVAYYAIDDDDAMKYGYILEAGMQGNLDKAYGIKLLSQSGEILCLYTTDSPRLDGSKVKDSEIHGVLEASANVDGTIKQLVRYRLNSEGFISELDTSVPNSTPDYDELQKTHVANGATYWNNTKTFVMSGTDERYILSDKLKLFLIPTDPQATDEDYQVRTGSYFSNNTSYGGSGQKLFVYNVKEAEPQAMELQISKASLGLGGVSQYNADLAVVVDHSRIAGDDGEEYISLKVMVTNAEKKLRINPDRVKLMRFEEGSITSGTMLDYDNASQLDFSDLKFGDLILFYEDDSGETRTVLKINDSDPRTWQHGNYAIQNKGAYLERMYGAVKTLSGRKVLLDVSSANRPEREIYANLLGSLQVYLVDFNTETVRTASFDDIIFSEIDSLSDKIFVRTRYYVPKQVVIYRGVEVTK